MHLQETVNIRQVKLYAMLIFINVSRHRREADGRSIWLGCFGGAELSDKLRVQRQRVI